MKFLQPQTLILVALALVILFWPKRFPFLGRSFGKPMKAFREDPREQAAGSEANSDSGPKKRKKA